MRFMFGRSRSSISSHSHSRLQKACIEALENRFLLAGDGLAAVYFNRSNPSQIYLQRVDPTINFSWGNTAPAPAVPQTNWQSEWTGQVLAPVSGAYTFSTTSDDGIRVWVNGTQIINDWSDHPPTVDNGTITLAAGQKYDIKVDFYQNAGGATCTLNWSAPGLAQQVVPQADLFSGSTPPPPGTSVNGLTGNYYLASNPTTPVLTRVDPAVNFDWSSTPPAPAVGLYQYNVEWTGQVLAPTTGSYTFTTTADDGVRLSVNGMQIINDWNLHPATIDNGSIALTAGQKYDIKLDYFQSWGGAVCQLAWSGPGFSTQIIPSGNLFTTSSGGSMGDTQAPSVPGGLAQQSVGTTTDTITWNASTDNVGVTGYNIFRNGSPIGSVGGGTTSFSDSGLSAGTGYTYNVLAFDAAGNQSSQSPPLLVTTQTVAPPPPGSGNGLLGTYYTASNPGTPVVTRIDPTVNFDWSSVGPSPAVGLYQYNVEWTGQVLAPTSGSYTFYVTSDDGARLWVNGVQLINDWSNHAATVDSGTITLTGGQAYSIKLDYLQSWGGAVCKLAWSSALIPQQIVPQADLFAPATTDTQAPSMPTGLQMTASTDTSATLTWNTSTDNVGVAGYIIYRNGVKVGTVTGAATNTYTDINLIASTNYSWTVAAFDAAQNVSTQSSPVSGSTKAPAGPTPPPIAGNWHSIFDDEFNTLNTNVWTNGRYWWNGNNGTQATFDPNQVSVKNGVLSVTAIQKTQTDTTGAVNPYTSGLLQTGGIQGQTNPSFSFTYGYIETRAQMAPGWGLWSALWLLPVSHQDSIELDMFEQLGRDPTTFNGFDHSWPNSGKSAIVSLPFDTTAAYHVYGLDWEPDHVTWYVDGVAIATYTDTTVIPQIPMYLIMNLDVGGDWAGPLNSSSPASGTWNVDYLRVWQKS